jgi:hypothetical protein
VGGGIGGRRARDFIASNDAGKNAVLEAIHVGSRFPTGAATRKPNSMIEFAIISGVDVFL